MTEPKPAAPAQDASNDAWIAYLDALASSYGQAQEEGTSKAGGRRAAEDSLIRGLRLLRVDDGKNTRMEVNLHAARLLIRLSNRITRSRREALEPKIRRAFVGTVMPHAAPLNGLRTLFATLVKFRTVDTLPWILHEFTHANVQRVSEVLAAHEALLHLDDAPGSVRYRVVNEFIKVYAAVEAIVTTDPSSPRGKELEPFWAQVGPGALAVVNRYAGRDMNEDAQPFSSFQEAVEWMRSHWDPERPPWTDA